MFVSSPPPPPPPPGSHQPCLNFNKNNSSDDRSILLESIRQGKSLKKTVTNDRSTPIIPGAVKNTNSSVNNSQSGSQSSVTNNKVSNNSLQSHAGLGGLFVNGIPKLKATGSPIGRTYQKSRHKDEAIKENLNANCNNESTVNNSNFSDTSKIKFDAIKNRGPPPQPPITTHKLQIVHSTELTILSTPVHNRMGSTLSLNNEDSSISNGKSFTANGGNFNSKPSVAPKPTGISQRTFQQNSNISNDNNSNNQSIPTRSMVARAQSMRVPKSPPVTLESNSDTPPQFCSQANQSELYRMHKKSNTPNFYQSQDSLNNRINKSDSPPRKWGQSATLRHNSSSRGGFSLRPPLSKPPPPPPPFTARTTLIPPACPPPPPPPPHRTTSMGLTQHVSPVQPSPSSSYTSGQNKSSANINAGNVPPTPPVRNSSMRNTNPVNKQSKDVELRYMTLFHKVKEFPSPPPYKNVIKIYNSRVQAKQRAPQPPPVARVQIGNRMWQSEEISNC